MRPKTFAHLLPLSITAYGLLFILLGLLLFGGFSWLAVDEIYMLQTESQLRNLHLAQEEMRETALHVLEEGEELAKHFAAWDKPFSN